MPKAVADWPLLLGGPMLRTVTPTSVSVFVALKHPREVRLVVLPPGSATTPLGEVEVETRQLGRYLHVALPAVTVGSAPLAPGNTYRYDVTLTAFGTRDALDTGAQVQGLGSQGLLTGTLAQFMQETPSRFGMGSPGAWLPPMRDQARTPAVG